MKLYAPAYYKEFKCIADKCSHSCCVGWEISVDNETLGRLELLEECEREEILSNIEGGVIRLCDDGRCPFLDKCGLCKIISRHGDAFISEICREHPRFYNFLTDRAEVGLGASCEEAARIILSSDEYDRIIPIGDCEGLVSEGYDAKPERDWIYSVLNGKTVDFNKKLSIIMGRYCLDEGLFSEDCLAALFSEIEYLREEDRELFSAMNSSGGKADSSYSVRFFAYLIYRHLAASGSYENLRARVGLCVALLCLFESLCSRGVEPTEAARLISEEIEYSEDNTDSLIFEFECEI